MGVTASGTSGAPFELPNSALADTLLERLTVTYAAAADPERAVSMRAYMKDIAPFLGLPTPERRALSRTVLAGYGPVPTRPTAPRSRCAAGRCRSASTTTSPSTTCAGM